MVVEGIQLKPEANNKFNFLPSRLCFIVYTYPNPKTTPYKTAKTVNIVVQCDKNYTTLMCALPVDKSVYHDYHLALTLSDCDLSCDRRVWFRIRENTLQTLLQTLQNINF